MTAHHPVLPAPFPWFGGKSRVAPEVWARFGDTPNYVEPFAGSLAVLLGRPAHHNPLALETVNDLDGYIANFWRAIARHPEETARWADWPVIEADLNARHAWLVTQSPTLLRRLEGDPLYCDPQIAGWWVAGVCAWIGSGYCTGTGPWRVVDGQLRKDAGTAGESVSRKLPHLGDGGRSINRQMLHLGTAGESVNRQMPYLGSGGRGINRKLPHLGSDGRGINRKLPHLGDGPIAEWFHRLSTRLRRVRVCNGDWTRVLTDTVTTKQGMTAVFLDPPYSDTITQARVYAHDSTDVAHDVRAWCTRNGSNPLLRIALCGYEGEGHDILTDHGWTRHAWKTKGGYGGGQGGAGEANQHRERVYFSPACHNPTPDLFSLDTP